MGAVDPAKFDPYRYTCEKLEDMGRYKVEFGSLATPSGPSSYTIVRMRPFACALAVVPGDEPRIVLAKQYRYAVDAWELELPAGGLEAGETPAEAAVRELREETGLIPEETVDLGLVYPSAGSTDEAAHLVAVRCAPGRVAQSFDAGEQVETLFVTRLEFERMLQEETFRHATGIVAWERFCARGLDRAWLSEEGRASNTGTVELATLNDVDELVRLRLAYVAEDGGWPDAKSRMEAEASLSAYFTLHLNDDLYVFVAREDRLVGCCMLLVCTLPPNASLPSGRVGTVLNVYVEPALRGRGLGTLLIEALVNKARAVGCDRLDLKATKAGEGLYRKLGFSPVDNHYSTMELRLA